MWKYPPTFFVIFGVMLRRLLIILLCLLPLFGFAQKKEKKKKKKDKDKVALVDRVANLFGTYQTKDTLLIYSQEEDPADTIPDVPERKKKNVFFGVKTKRAFTIADAGGCTVVEDFYIFPEAVEVDPYVLAIYRHDTQRERVVGVRPRNNQATRVLHGPYKKLIDDKVVEEGMYFYGTKHQRWTKLTRQNILTSKQHFHKGWFRDSEIEYYDGAGKEKIKSVLPIQYGKKEGTFIQFHQNGQIAVRGSYQYDKKVGIWEEFYDVQGVYRVKREIQFAPDAFRKDFKPYIRKEFDRNGDLIYQSPKIPKPKGG